MRIFVAGLAASAALWAAPVAAQEAPSGSDQPDTTTRETFTAGAISALRQQQDRMDRVLDRRGRRAEALAVRALVAASGVRARLAAGQSGANQAQLDELLRANVSQQLTASGFTGARIRSLRARGIDPVAASDALLSLQATPEQKALLAEGVYEVTFVDRRDDNSLGDGHNSTLNFRIETVVAGTGAVGELIAIRQISGTLPDGSVLEISVEFVPDPGDRFMIFTSRSLYEQAALMNGGQPSDATGVTLFASAPYRIAGEQLAPTATGQPQANAARTAVRSAISSLRARADRP